jgi:hypothetical protein
MRKLLFSISTLVILSFFLSLLNCTSMAVLELKLIFEKLKVEKTGEKLKWL